MEFFRGLYLVPFDETLEKFDPSSMFSECGIFQRSALNTFLMKLLRSFDFHRCFLSVDIFRGSHSVYFDETLEKFGLLSILSKSGIFQRFTLGTFLTKPLRSLVFHAYFPEHFIWNSRGVWTFTDIFQVREFFRDPHVVYFAMKLSRSSDFLWCFLSVDFFRGPLLVHFRWNTWEVWSSIDIF